MTSAAKARAYRKAHDLLGLVAAQDLLDCAAYMAVTNADWWRLHPMTLEAVEKQLRTWIPAGRPTGHERRARVHTRAVARPKEKGDRTAYDPAPDYPAERTSLDAGGDAPRPGGASARALPPTDDAPLF
jgi:hypothetical protein